MRWGGFGRRVGAALIDAVAVVVLTLTLAIAVGVLAGAAGASQAVLAALGPIAFGVSFWAYFAPFEGRAPRSTIGKEAFHITVTHRGGAVGLARATLRQAAKLLLFPGLLVAVVEPRGRALHDLVAGTEVVRT